MSQNESEAARRLLEEALEEATPAVAPSSPCINISHAANVFTGVVLISQLIQNFPKE